MALKAFSFVNVVITLSLRAITLSVIYIPHFKCRLYIPCCYLWRVCDFIVIAILMGNGYVLGPYCYSLCLGTFCGWIICVLAGWVGDLVYDWYCIQNWVFYTFYLNFHFMLYGIRVYSYIYTVLSRLDFACTRLF